MEKSGSALPVSADLASSRRGVHPLQSVIRHKWIAFWVVAAASVAAVPVLTKLRRPVFYAEAILMVSPVTKTLEDREAQLPRYTEYVNQQAMMLSREDVALAALDRLGENRSRWQRPEESARDAAVRLSNSLRVTRVPETSYLTVGLEGGEREGLVEIINAVTKAYLDHSKGQSLAGVDTRTEVLTRRVVDIQEEIRTKTDQISRWCKELGVPGMESTMLNPLVMETERAQREAEGKRVQAEARQAGVVARYKVLRAAEADRSTLAPDPELQEIRGVLLAKKSELKAKLFGLTPAHEGRKAVEAEIADIEAELDREEKAAHERQTRAAIRKLEEAEKNDLAVSQAEVAQAKRYEEVVAKETAELNEKLIRTYPEAQGVLAEVERLRRQLGLVQERVDALRLETFAPGFVQLVMPAALSEVPGGRRTLKAVGLLGGATLFLIFALPVGLDLIRNRVIHETDVEGPVLTLSTWDGNKDRDPAVADQLRRLALALDRERRLHNRSAFVFTSVLPGAGTTQLVLDVARELGDFGVMTLAIEANALKPDPKYGANGHPGLGAGMTKGIRASEMVIPADRFLPDRIAVGPTEGRTTLPGLERIDSFLGQVLGRYMAVLIDAPPILKSADAEYLATRGQPVVLVVEADRTPFADLDRAKRILNQSRANVVLTVLNRARSRKETEQKAMAAPETSGRPLGG